MNDFIPGQAAARHLQGQADAASHIVSNGLESAKAKHAEMLPPGEPCKLAIEDFQYWSGWLAKVREAQTP